MATLFLIVSKVGWTLIKPETWFFVLMLAAFLAVVRGWRRLAAWSLGVALAAFAALAIWPLGMLPLKPLENRFPVAPEIPAPALILVLGGGEEAHMTAASRLPATNAAGERFAQAAALARRHPDATLAFTGGSGWFVAGGLSGADVAARLFADAGIAADRVRLEGRSRNTWQNAVYSREAIGAPTDGPVLLVTSAFHMPRAVGVFCAAGWSNLAAWPVDHRAQTGLGTWSWFFARNLETLNLAVKEWVGLAVYAMTDRYTAYAVAPDGTVTCG